MTGRTSFRGGHSPEPEDLAGGGAALSLARSLAGMRATLQATTNAILVIGYNAKVTDFNERLVQMWSLPADVIGKLDDAAILDWMQERFADSREFRGQVASIYAHDSPTTDVLTLLDGRVIERRSTPVVVHGTTAGRVWSFVDITASLLTQQLLREEAEVLGWLIRTGLALNSTLEPQAVVEATTRASASLSGARFASFIPHPARAIEELPTVITNAAGHSPAASIMKPDIHQALAQATREWQHAFHCDDLEQDEATRRLFAGEDLPHGGLAVRSLLVVPLAPRPDLVLGALTFEHHAPGGLTDRVQRLIGALAPHAAVALDNARLHSRLRRESKERKLLSKLQKSSADRLRNLSRRLMQAEEEERKRLGRELHDRVGANLSALGMGLELLRNQLPDERDGPVTRRIGDLQGILQDTMTHVRAVLADLRPTALDELGLVSALRHQAGVLTARSGIQFLVEGSEPSPRLAPECEIAFYRIAQEAWANATKHSGAQSVALTVADEGDQVTMTIEDDGNGFEPAELPAGTPSLGLTTMRERAEAIGALLEVGTVVGAGVSVYLSLARALPARG